MMMRFLAIVALLAVPAVAQEGGGFADAPNGAVAHRASGFVCPLKIGIFVRDAAGPRDPDKDADYCAYSALSGVYGTIIVMPLPGNFDPKAALAGEFAVQEGKGGRVIDEAVRSAGPAGAAIPVYMRTYETARLESLHYHALFASAVVGGWSVQVIVEYAFPRDKDIEAEFLNSVYSAAQRDIGAAPAKP
jgi:hypothetical protein